MSETDKEWEALIRLIEIGCSDTGQSRKVANFLLAWWNAETCGGFDLTDMWAVDNTIRDDMIAVMKFISNRHGSYPDKIGLKEHFHDILRQWRPDLLEEAG